ncbi:MAG: hypothetical protein FJ125_01205 [Deltaproteobacteria bacterium]|nr:hypothetical protein [Deltaproteobacteria bacterium]
MRWNSAVGRATGLPGAMALRYPASVRGFDEISSAALRRGEKPLLSAQVRRQRDRASCTHIPATLLSLLLFLPAGAAAEEPPERSLLHEPVPDSPGRAGPPAPRTAEPRLEPAPLDRLQGEVAPAPPGELLWPAAAAQPSDQPQLPEAILLDGLGLHPPDEGPLPSAEELPYQARPPAGGAAGNAAGTSRDPVARLDRLTGPDGLLTYHEVFNPAVAPFKRDASYDRVVDDESLTISTDAPPEQLAVGPPRAAGGELFWGSLVARLTGGEPVPIPSVAADARILAYRTDPSVGLTFFRDVAGNFSVRPQSPFSGAVRLIFLGEAPSTAFGGPVPDFALDRIPAALRPRVPLPVRQKAATVLRLLGITAATRPRDALFLLVEHFRSFTAGPPPPVEAGASTYLDLTLARRGVCRHRAMAFVITAQSFGLPAHYVHNEAHAFAEVYLPGGGWRRIDLGGASAGLQIRNGMGRIPHQPRLADPFPRPEAYTSSYSVEPFAPARSRSSTGSAEGPGGGGEDGGDEGEAAPAGTSGAGDPRLRSRAAARAPGEAGSGGATRHGPGSRADGGYMVAGPADGGTATTPQPPHLSPPPARPAPWSVVLARASPRTFRGEAAQVAGTVQGEDGTAIPGAVVALLLLRPGRSTMLLGLLHGDEQGRFAGTVPIPADLAPGGYEIEAVDGRPWLGE